MSRFRLGAAVVALGFLAGCGSSGSPTPDVIQAGQLDIQLPPGWKVTHEGASAPGSGGAVSQGASAEATATTTIPLNKQNPTTEFFQATANFSACLKGQGVTFVGAPNPADPSSPSNSPTYLKSLETCAAQSHIVQALQDFQSSQNNLTPKQILQENQSYLRWRTCMIGRGWQIPTPVPDSKGRLFSVSAGGTGQQLVPPPGQDILDSPDIQACSDQTQAATSGQG